MKRKHALSALALVVALGAVPMANAYILLVSDFEKLKQAVTNDIKRSMEWMKENLYIQELMDAKKQYFDSSIDTINNGAANTVARLNGVLQEVTGLEQQSRQRPVQDACEKVYVQQALSDQLCNDDVIGTAVNDAIQVAPTGISDMYLKIKSRLDGQVSSVWLQAADDGSSAPAGGKREKTEAEKLIDTYNERMLAAYDQHKAWEDAGKQPLADDASLLFLSQNASPIYSTEELQMAVNQALITYRPYINLSRNDPTTEAEIVSELRKKNARGLVTAMVGRQIALRTAVADGQPSKLMLQTLPAEMYLDEDGSPSTDGESFIHKVALNSATSPAENARDDLLMAGVDMQLAIERLKSTLLIEQMLVQKATVRLDQLQH